MKLLDELERLTKETNKRHECLPVYGEWGYYHASKEDLSERFIHVLYRAGVYLLDRKDYAYAATCINAVPHLINELQAARKVISYAKSLFSEDDAFNAVSHFNVAFELRNALKEYEEVVK